MREAVHRQQTLTVKGMIRNWMAYLLNLAFAAALPRLTQFPILLRFAAFEGWKSRLGEASSEVTSCDIL